MADTDPTTGTPSPGVPVVDLTEQVRRLYESADEARVRALHLAGMAHAERQHADDLEALAAVLDGTARG